MKRMLPYFIALLLCLFLWWWAIWLTVFFSRNDSGLKVHNFPLIKKGMTQPEVESLLGGPAGRYGNSTGKGFMSKEGRPIQPNNYTIIRTWNDKMHWFEVYFDANDQVVAAYPNSSYFEVGEKKGYVRPIWQPFWSALGF